MIKQVEFIKSAELPKDFPETKRMDLVMIGRSNVGKSSFINKLTKRRNIARVSKNPGCTQYLNFFLANKSFYIVDLPGYGFAKVPNKVKNKWKVVIERYLKSDRPKIGFVLVDVKRDIGKEEKEIIEWLSENKIECKIINTKIDKLGRNELRSIKRDSNNFFISSKSGEGFAEVDDYLKTLLREKRN